VQELDVISARPNAGLWCLRHATHGDDARQAKKPKRSQQKTGESRGPCKNQTSIFIAGPLKQNITAVAAANIDGSFL